MTKLSPWLSSASWHIINVSQNVAVISQLTHLHCEKNVTLAFMPIAMRCCQKSSWSVNLVFVILTSLAGASQVSRPGAVADVAIPALPADAVVLAGVGQALFGLFSGAGRLHPHRLLGLSQPPDVFALTVHEQVSDAAHVTVVQQSRPHLRRRSPVLSGIWELPASFGLESKDVMSPWDVFC